MNYVRKFTVLETSYVVAIVMFLMNWPTYDANPARWQLWASLIYFVISHVCLANVVYIRRTLDKKLGTSVVFLLFQL